MVVNERIGNRSTLKKNSIILKDGDYLRSSDQLVRFELFLKLMNFMHRSYGQKPVNKYF